MSNRPIQQNLFGKKEKVNKVSHANLGKGFEGDIERTNEYYLRRGIANIKKNPLKWQVVSEKEYYQALKEKELPEGMFAKTENGLFMIAEQSDVDYTGPALGHSIEFDAKTTQRPSIPLKNFREHQIINLINSERAGAIAGFMVEFSEKNRVFFVKASFVRACKDKYLYQSRGKKQATRGTASISIALLEERAVEIPCRNDLVDYLQVLIPRQ